MSTTESVKKVPLYLQVKQGVEQEIQSGRWQVGQKIYTEDALIEKFRVSRITAIRALSELTKEGYLKREQGKGTILITRTKKSQPEIVYFLTKTPGHVSQPLAESLLKNLGGNGYHIITYDASSFNFNDDTIKQMLDFRGKAVVIIGDFDFPFYLLDRYRDKLPRIFFVLVYEGQKKYPGTYITSDFFFGGYLTGKHLIERGYDRFIFFTLSLHKTSIHARKLEGIKKAMAEKGIHTDKLLIVEQERGENRDEEAMEKLSVAVKESGKNVGIACCLDYMASSAYRVIKNLGWKIPDDAGVTGYNNTPWVRVFNPPLTSVSIREADIGKETALAIRGDLRTDKLVAPILFERASTDRGKGE